MQNFFNNLWKNVQDFYFKVRNLIATGAAKLGVVQYAEKIILSIRLKEAIGGKLTFTDHLKRIGGYILHFGFFAVLGALIGFLSYFVIMALSFVIGEILAVFLVTVLRTLFIFDLVYAIYKKVDNEKYDIVSPFEAGVVAA